MNAIAKLLLKLRVKQTAAPGGPTYPVEKI